MECTNAGICTVNKLKISCLPNVAFRDKEHVHTWQTFRYRRLIHIWNCSCHDNAKPVLLATFESQCTSPRMKIYTTAAMVKNTHILFA
jgi:hypothetical protein